MNILVMYVSGFYIKFKVKFLLNGKEEGKKDKVLCFLYFNLFNIKVCFLF